MLRQDLPRGALDDGSVPAVYWAEARYNGLGADPRGDADFAETRVERDLETRRASDVRPGSDLPRRIRFTLYGPGTF